MKSSVIPASPDPDDLRKHITKRIEADAGSRWILRKGDAHFMGDAVNKNDGRPDIKVMGISWVGIGTECFNETVEFFTNVLGLETALIEEPVAMLHAGAGSIVEIFGPGSTRGKALNTPPAVAFEVEDVAVARDALLVAGVELIGDVGTWNGFEWLYFRGPENYIFSVKKTPAAGWDKT